MSAEGNTFSTQVFAAGGATFVVRCSSTTIRDVVESLFGDLETGVELPDTAEIVVEDSGEDGWSVRFGEDDSREAQPADWAMAKLITDISRLALDADPARLHLHCAALSLDGRGVLVSAESGTGKTTLAAALVQRGWTYVTDEMVAVQIDDPIARGFPKPLSLKPGGHTLLPGILGARAQLDGRSDDETWAHVCAGSLSEHVDHQVEPAVIVILHRAVDVELTPVALHPVDAVVALMAQTMDPQRYGPDAVTALAQQAARCRCVSLAIGPLESMSSEMRSLVSSAPERQPLKHLEPPVGFDLDGWSVAEGVRSIVIGERVVVHDTVGGAIVAFDESGTATWEALHGTSPTWWSGDTLSAAGTISFLETLRSHGLVTRATAKEPVRT